MDDRMHPAPAAVDAPSETVVEWMLAGDPAIRWQVRRDLLDSPTDMVARERARVAREGFGRRLLALQGDDGKWGNAAWNRGWNSTMHALLLLRELGVDPSDALVGHAIALVQEHVTWRDCAPPECDDNPFFAGEVEPCINAQVAAAGAYLGAEVRALVTRLLGEQLADGGWNCEAERGATRSSFHTTICVLEALLEFERRVGERDVLQHSLRAARHRGEEYLLARQLFRRLSTGEAIVDRKRNSAAWDRFAVPCWWHYDVLRGLDYLRSAGVVPDERARAAIEIVRSQRGGDGRWVLGVQHEGTILLDLGERAGEVSRWVTLRALRVLRWWGAGTG